MIRTRREAVFGWRPSATIDAEAERPILDQFSQHPTDAVAAMEQAASSRGWKAGLFIA